MTAFVFVLCLHVRWQEASVIFLLEDTTMSCWCSAVAELISIVFLLLMWCLTSASKSCISCLSDQCASIVCHCRTCQQSKPSMQIVSYLQAFKCVAAGHLNLLVIGNLRCLSHDERPALQGTSTAPHAHLLSVTARHLNGRGEGINADQCGLRVCARPSKYCMSIPD